MSSNFFRSKIFKNLLEDSYREHVPVTVLLELTNRCNERCIHCYVDHSKSAEMGFCQWKAVLDQLKSLGALILTLSGGESLLHPDFQEIYTYAHRNNFAIRLFTNGLILDHRILELLETYKPLDVQFSIYGHTPELHDSITGVSGSFERTAKALKSVSALGIPVFGKCSWLSQNADYFREIQELVLQMGAEFSGNAMIAPARSPDKNTPGCRVADAQFERLTQWGRSGRDEIQESIEEPAGDNSLDRNLCGAGVITMRISAQGDVYPCTDHKRQVGNVKDKSLEDIWNNSPFLAKLRRLRHRDRQECLSCELQPDCFHCHAQAYNEKDDLLACYSEAMRYARIRQSMEA